MPTAGTVTLTTDAATFFTGACTEFTVWNDGAAAALINVTDVHDASEWFSIASGGVQSFTIEARGLTQVRGKTAAGTAAIRYGITAVLDRE